MKTKLTLILLLILFPGWLSAETPQSCEADININLNRYPIEFTADWTFGALLENTVLFDFQAGVSVVDSVQVNGTDVGWEQSGNQFAVEVENSAAPTEISIRWHSSPDSQSDGIRKRDTEDTHSITAISSPLGPSLWIPVPAGSDFRLTGSLSFTMPTDMDGVATGSRVSDTAVADGHCVRYEIINPVSPQQLFFAMASGREIETSSLSTLTGDRPFTIYPYPGLQQECETDFAPVPALVSTMEQWFGPFPDVPDHTFSACAMDFDQVIATPGILAIGQGFISGSGEETIDKRLANGLAGQWWGYQFPVYNPAHSWVTEGLRSYSEVLVSAAETTGSEESPRDLAGDILKEYDTGGSTLEGPLVVSDGNPYSHPYVLTAKGAYTLHMLRMILGDDPFFCGMKELAKTDNHATATNRLQFALEKETRFPVGPFLRQWTLRSPRPVLSYRFDQTGNRLVLDISQWDPGDGEGIFQIPLQVQQGEDETTVWLTEQNQRFFLPEKEGTPELDPHSHTLKLAISDTSVLDAPELNVSLSPDNTKYPFQLVPNFSQLPDGTESWLIDGIPAVPTANGNLLVRTSGAHTVQVTILPPGQAAVSEVLAVDIPQPDGDLNADGKVDAADLATVLRDSTRDPIPNGIRDNADISYISNLLLGRVRDGIGINPPGGETSTEWQLQLQGDTDSVAAGHTSSISLKIHGPSLLQLAVLELEFDPDKVEPLSPEATSDAAILFSSVSGGTWTLALGSTGDGIDCSEAEGKPIVTVRFRSLQGSGSANIRTGEESYLFPHNSDTIYLPSSASANLGFSEGVVRLPLVPDSDKWETSLGLIEAAGITDNISLTAADHDGNAIATATISLAPGQQTVQKLTELFGNIPTVSSVRLTTGAAVHAWVEYRDKNSPAAAACPASTETESQLLVPHVDEGLYWNTVGGVVNCGDSPAILTFTASGNQITVNENTAPSGGYNGRFINLLNETLLQGGWGIFDGSNAPLAGAELFYRVDNLHQAAALSMSGKTARRFYFPHIDTSGFWWTGISLINPGNVSATIKMEAFDTNGHVLPDSGQSTGTATFSIPAQTRRVDLVGNFFNNQLDPKTAWIRVTSDLPLTGLEIFGSRSGFQEDLSAGLEAVSEPSVSLTFPWAADGSNQQWCGLALLNPDETMPAEDITVTLYSNNGIIVGMAALHLDPLQKHVVLLRDLFGGTVPADGAYLHVQSDIPLVGFALSGSDDHQWLMGLNGL